MHDGPSQLASRATSLPRGISPRFLPDHSPHLDSTTTLSSKLSTSFTTSLSIAVEGATPIYSDYHSEPVPHVAIGTPQQVSPSINKRAPRKSKTDALAALHTHARSPSLGPDDPGYQENETNFFAAHPPIPVSPTLDLSSVKTCSPRMLPPRPNPRPFDLEDCPTFYPTMEEFKDALAYIRSISDQAVKFGLCKIVPPAEWTMPFVTDTATFRFKTRVQQLNSIEASSRAKVNFLEQLYRFHKQQGNPRVAVPSINHKPLDLWRLRKEVQEWGGYDMVTKDKKWSDIGRSLGYGGIPGLSTQLKNSYTRVILPYEHFCERVRNSPSLSSLKPPSNNHSSVTPPRPGTAVDDVSPPSSPLTTTSSPLSEPPDDPDYRDSNGNRPARFKPRRSRMGSHEQVTQKRPGTGASRTSPFLPPPMFYDNPDVEELREVETDPSSHGSKTVPVTIVGQENCEICHKKNRGEEMLLCDGCDCGFHIFCLDPPLTTIPKGQWFCHTCLFGTGGDFGFDEGEEHSLSSFQARDLEFRRRWFKSHPPPPSPSNSPEIDDITINRFGDVLVSEFDVENEFWRLVQSQHETVEVEYGADVHSTTHGSAMPTIESHPDHTHSTDPWNLNNIPIASDSLLRFIKSDISGMTVPWTYVGMVFSTFCWHNEDHYTYSINFMHWGETKTWYGIPGEDAEKFEAAIKCEAPDLFEAQPDLLFQLVTLMNPKRLKDAGVRVYACNQRAGEFVVTFPKAYHAGLNHGLNFNEAVNFALPDWLSFGRDCVQRYREHRKSPVFSHDELLVTITQQSQSVKTATWLVDSLEEMIAREIHDRKRARSMGFTEKLEEEDRPEDQNQCAICKSFCYLSQVTCACTSEVVCVDHANLLCDHYAYNLRKRISDDDLLEIQAKFSERAAIPSTWGGKLKRLLQESLRPQLRSLRALLAEGERVSCNLTELAALRRCVSRANDWVDSANMFITRKQSRKRPRRSRGRPPLNEAFTNIPDDQGDRPDRGLDDLYALLGEVDEIGFDCPEIGVLRVLAQQAEEVKAKSRALLQSTDIDRDRDAYVQDCERLLLEGSSLNVYLDELAEIERIVLREQLVKELEDKVDDSKMTLAEVRQLLARAQACNLGSINNHVKVLEARRKTGDDWEVRAKAALSQPHKTIEDLEKFCDVDTSVPVDLTLLDRITNALHKAREFEKQAKVWLSSDTDIRPKVQDVMKLVTRAERDFDLPAINDLKRAADFALDLETQCDQVLRNRYRPPRYAPGEAKDVFEVMGMWKTYARDHLRMFTLPTFERLDLQLALHSHWLERLPWYCTEHKVAHGQQILDDVIESTRPEDDLPPNDEYFTCICTAAVRPPPPGTVSDAVQCDHCFARFHGICAANGGSCPFCDHHHWNGTIHKERSWHFCFLPTILLSAPEITRHYSQDWKQLEIIVHRIDRLSSVIGHFLSFASQPGNQRDEYIPQVRHYMRKLYKIQFAVSPNREVSFGLDLAGLHRLLASQPAPIRMKKRRRPRFVFGPDNDQDAEEGTRCVCRGRNPFFRDPRDIQNVECEICSKLYHAPCVFVPHELFPVPELPRFTCPLCSLRKNRTYPYAQIRVKPIEGTNHEPDVYVDTKEMLDTFSKDIIYVKLPAPYVRRTVFVELVRFIPGQPDGTINGSSTRSAGITVPRPPITHADSSHSHSPVAMGALNHSTHPSTFDVAATRTATDHHVPPPPWSRWGTMATPSMPPSTQRRQPADSSRGATQPPKKRKHVEEMRPTEDTRAPSPSSSSRSTKRRIVPQPPPVPSSVPPVAPPQPPRPVQTLSPSLAMIVSPPETESSPRLVTSTSFTPSTVSIPASPSSHSARAAPLVLPKVR